MEKKLCGAKTKSTGAPCKRQALPNGRCKFHGGRSAKGIQHGNFKHGRYSKYMPKGLGEQFEASLQDVTLMDHAQQIALEDTFIKQQLKTLETGGNPVDDWQAIYTLWSRAQAIMQGHGKIDDLLPIINEGVARCKPSMRRAKVWREVQTAMERKRKHIEAYDRTQQQNAIPVEQVVGMLVAVAHSIDAIVTNRKEQSALKARVQEFITID